jgi:hypothetical protein
MANSDLESTDFHVSCKGRNEHGQEVLENAVDVIVNVHKHPGDNTIMINPVCIYLAGPHGERCRTSFSKDHKYTGEEKIRCVYSIDIPYEIDMEHKSE